MGFINWFRELFKASSFTGVHNEPEDTLRLDRAAIAAAAGEPIELDARTLSESKDVMEKAVEMAKAGLAAGKISENFTMSEVACRDRDRTLPTGRELGGAEQAAGIMEAIRDHFGGRPITVNSWYRTPAYNRQVGGAKNSAHMRGHAVDFTVAGMTPRQVQAALRKAIASGKLAMGGLGCYATFTHIDLGKRRTWEG